MKNNTYTCSRCDKTLMKAWEDDKAFSEFEQTFGRPVDSTDVVVCDDCYKMIMSVTGPVQKGKE